MACFYSGVGGHDCTDSRLSLIHNEILRCLVGSEMCIRDRNIPGAILAPAI
ncbi:hypothetical protein ACX3V1_00730 [Escherichia coli]